MGPWLEAGGVLLLGAAGSLIGAWFSRRPRPWWTVGYIVPLSIVLLFVVGNHVPALTFAPPFSWLFFGRTRFACGGFVGAMVLTTPLLRLPLRRDRIAVFILMVSLVTLTSVFPFLAPAFNQKYLSQLTTTVDADGICRQSTDYTCGPAAAVTALRRLGFDAQEGEIAILAHTTAFTGTPADILADVLRGLYGRQGLICEYRLFTSLDELKQAGLTLVVTKYNLAVDHFVTVLEVNDQGVVIGDPLAGRIVMAPDEFVAKWRFAGIVLGRKSAGL